MVFWNKTILVLCALLACAFCSAQTLGEIASERDARLERALLDLARQRSSIATERLPLAQDLKALEREVAQLRESAAVIHRRRDSMGVDLETLRSQVEAEQKELDYITRTLLPEYVSAWDAALSPAQRSSEGERIRSHNVGLDSVSLTPSQKTASTLELVSHTCRLLENSLGGSSYDAQVLDEAGVICEAQVIEAGPFVYAYAPQLDAGGVLMDARSDYAKLIVLGGYGDVFKELVSSGNALVPVDPTLGDALLLTNVQDSLGEHLDKGGVWVYPILLFALIATCVAILKSIEIFKIRDVQAGAIHRILKHVRAHEVEAALAVAKRQSEPSRAMLVCAVEHADESVELVEEVMYESILHTQPRLERYLNVIAVTAATAPLLGLLGTVTGIIKTFKLMSVYGAGDPQPLISGISEALITTELGLVLAIPALLIHALLSRKVAGILSRMEKTALALVNGLSRKS